MRLSYIWIVPLIAAAVGGYLFYKAEIDVGPTITITFEDGTNISHGAKLVYRGVEVGKVATVALDPDLGKVDVRASGPGRRGAGARGLPSSGSSSRRSASVGSPG